MSTETTAKRQRRKKPATKFIVQKSGVDCGWATALDLGLANKLSSGHIFATTMCGKRGLLVKKPEDPAVFGGERSANKYIAIAKRVADKLRGTMVDEMPKLAPLLEPGVFTTRTFQQ